MNGYAYRSVTNELDERLIKENGVAFRPFLSGPFRLVLILDQGFHKILGSFIKKNLLNHSLLKNMNFINEIHKKNILNY